MPQHWVNVLIGLILIAAVLGDIWFRQQGILASGSTLAPSGAGGRRTREDSLIATPFIEMRDINKAFGAVQALRNVNLHLMPGEILGLVGDNSAGKSTLMKVLTGAYLRDTGDVLVDGSRRISRRRSTAASVGIEMIYQDFALCGNMDIGQNIFLGRWPRRLRPLRRPRAHVCRCLARC